MLGRILNSLSGLRVSYKKLQNSANNLANISTPGFVKGRLELTSIPNGGVSLAAASRTNSQGNLKTPNNVDITNEMVGQVETYSTFKSNTKIIKASNETTGLILNIKT
tara:strand:+ start:615 stop:938 length:324 start_codon:yes stop_codon:yes gene_type:complete